LPATLVGLTEVDVYSKLPGRLLEKRRSEGDLVQENEVVCLVDRDEPAMKFEPVAVRSPIAGMVLRYNADIGNSVLPQSGLNRPLFTVARIDRVKAELHVGERDAARIRTGQVCRVYTSGNNGSWHSGSVVRVSPAFDPMTGKSRVEVELANPDRALRPGMFVIVEIVTAVRRNVILIPRSAVTEETYGERSVVTVVRDDKAYERDVTTGIANERMVEVLTGLQPGEELVVQGFYGIIDGTPVRRVNQ
jgi:RND family efflux transporter MFP subunit